MDIRTILYQECNCGCAIMKIHKDDDCTWIEYYISGFYANQEGLWSIIKSRVKAAWCMLTGKKFHLYDIMIQGQKEEEFYKNMKQT